MSDPTNPSVREHNLLLCLLALQNNIITREQLLTAFSIWAADKEQDLVQLLVNQAVITDADFSLLRQLVELHLRTFDGDAAASLTQMSSVSTVKQALRSLVDDPLLAGEIPWFSETLDHGLDRSTNRNRSSDTFERANANRFRIVKEHARGGLGVVYVAVDTQLRREVAVKQIRADRVTNSAYRDKFSLEAEVTGQLEHPGIVPVYALGVDDTGAPFYAMRFVRGEDLHARIKKFHTRIGKKEEVFDGVELRGLLRRFIDVCNAVEYAHDRGVLHRDLKPGNIMLGKHGETLVVDWGLAKASGKHFFADTTGELSELPIQSGSSGATSETAYGSFIGTPAYAPPEQVLGKLEELGPPSDVYSLGAIMYELLSGCRAIEAADVHELAQKVVAGDFREPRQHNKLISKSLNAVCMKAMATRPFDRYQTVGLLRRDIESWLSDLPVTARRESLTDQAHRWFRKHRSLATASIFSVLIIGLISTFAAYRMNYLRGQEAAARKQSDIDKASAQRSQKQSELDKTAAEAARKQVSAQSREFRLAAAEDFFEAGLFAYDAGNLEQSDRLLQHSWINAKASQELLNRLQPVILDRLNRGGRRIGFPLRHDYPVQDTEFSYTGQYLVTSTGRRVRVWDSETSALITELDIAPIVSWARFIHCSPVANELLVGGDSTVKVFSIPDGKVLNTFEREWDRAANPAGTTLAACFSNSGKSIAIGRIGEATIYDIRTGVALQEFTCPSDSPMLAEIFFNKDDTRLTYGVEQQTVATWIVGNNSPVPDKTFGGGGIALKGTKQVFSVYPQHYSNIFFDKFTDAKPVGGASMWNFRDLTVSPLGLFAATRDSRVARLWSLGTGEPVGRHLHHAETITDIAFSPDGATIASSSMDATVMVWDAISGTQLVGPMQHTNTVNSVRYNRDGTLLATSSADKSARIWSVQNGKELARIPHSKQVSFATFHPSKSILASVSDATVQLWDFSSDLPRFLIRRHVSGASNTPESPYSFFRLSPTGSIVATATYGQVALWDVSSGHLIGQQAIQNGIVNDIAFSPDETQVAIAARGPQLIQWNFKKNVTHTQRELLLDPQLLRYSPDGSRLAVGAWSNNVTNSDACLAFVNTTSNTILGQHRCVQQTYPVRGLRFEYSGTGESLFLASGIENSNTQGAVLTEFNTATAVPIRELHKYSPSLIFKLVVVPNSEFFAVATPASTDLFAFSTGELVASLAGSTDVSFSHDGRLVLIRSVKETVVLNRTTGEKLLTMMVNEQGASAKLCGVDDTICASMMVSKSQPRGFLTPYPEQTLTFTDTRTGWRMGFEIPDVRSFELSPDHQSVVVHTSEGILRRDIPTLISEPVATEMLNAITGYAISDETGESHSLDLDTLQRFAALFLDSFLTTTRLRSPKGAEEVLKYLATRYFVTQNWFACQRCLDELEREGLLDEEQSQWVPLVKHNAQLAEDHLRARCADALIEVSVQNSEFEKVQSTISEVNAAARYNLVAAFAAEVNESWAHSRSFYETLLAEHPNNPEIWKRYRNVLKNQAAVPASGNNMASGNTPTLNRTLEAQLSRLDNRLMEGVSDEQAASAVSELQTSLEISKALAHVDGSVASRLAAYRSLFTGELFDPTSPDWRLAITYALNRSDPAISQSCVKAADNWFNRLPEDQRPSANWLKGYALAASDVTDSSLLPSPDSTEATADSCFFLAKVHLINGREEECKSAILRSRELLKADWADKPAIWKLPWYQRVMVEDLYSQLSALESQLK